VTEFTRRFERHSMALPVTIQGGGRTISAHTRQVGLGGCYAVCSTPPEEGESVVVDISLTAPREGTTVSAKGQVVYVLSDGVGISFSEIDEAAQEILWEFFMAQDLKW